jgi:hypothetical protein
VLALDAKRKHHEEPTPAAKIAGHSFDDLDGLDPRLRPGLTEAGFPVHEFSDRYLLTVASAAKAKARGTVMFVSSKLAPMVDWAAKNLYGKKAV